MIEHLPILSDDSFQTYIKTYDAHLEKMSKEKWQSVDERFWPDPDEFEDDSTYAQCG